MSEFLKIADKKGSVDNSGAAVIMALIVNDTCYVANVGDCRAILSLDGGKTIRQITTDHKPDD